MPEFYTLTILLINQLGEIGVWLQRGQNLPLNARTPLFSYVPCSPILSLFPCSPQNLAFVPLFPWNKCPFPLIPQTPGRVSIVHALRDISFHRLVIWKNFLKNLLKLWSWQLLHLIIYWCIVIHNVNPANHAPKVWIGCHNTSWCGIICSHRHMKIIIKKSSETMNQQIRLNQMSSWGSLSLLLAHLSTWCSKRANVGCVSSVMNCLLSTIFVFRV